MENNADNIFLIGFMGVGKSTIARCFNHLRGMEVVEMDQIIAENNGMSIPTIFEIYGEEYFRNQETELLRQLQEKGNVVISCGGGVPMRECNVEEMRKSGKIILLAASPATILERVKDNHDRPLLENNKTVESISELLNKRKEKYEQAADLIINTDDKIAVEICEEIIDRLQKL